jgi:hypothetical protein
MYNGKKLDVILYYHKLNTSDYIEEYSPDEAIVFGEVPALAGWLVFEKQRYAL